MYYRENLVKIAVSGLLGKDIKQHCGGANLRAGQDCSVPRTVSMSARELCSWIARWQVCVRRVGRCERDSWDA